MSAARLSPLRRRSLALVALGLSTSACLPLFIVDEESGSNTSLEPGSTSTPTTSTTGEPAPTSSTSTSEPETTAPDPSTDPTTGAGSTTGEPPPPPTARCNLVDAPDLLATTCAGDDACQLREVMRLECEGDSRPLKITRAPGDDAALYVQLELDEDRTNHEAFRLRTGASGPAGLWMTRDDYFDVAHSHLLAGADGPFELFYQFGDDPVTQLLADAGIDPEGFSLPLATHPDISWIMGSGVHPDGTPTLFFRPEGAQGVSAVLGLGPDQSKQPLVGFEASAPAIHEVAGQPWITWVADEEEFTDDPHLFTRPLADDPQAPGTPIVPLGDGSAPDILAAALSPFGGGTHGVALVTEEYADPTLVAGPPWSFSEVLTKEVVGCKRPTCNEGCEAAPACPEAHIEALPLALQAGSDSVREWHIECAYDSSVAWKQGSYFDLLCLCNKCRCEETILEKVDHPCELVASALQPDPNFPEQLRRNELWRRSLGLTRPEIQSVTAAASGDTLWMALDRTIYAVDTTAPGKPPECGNAILEGDEPCDGPELGAGQCTDYPGLGGGDLACDASCSFDTAGCCKAPSQPCQADGECCPGTACKYDLQALKKICK